MVEWVRALDWRPDGQGFEFHCGKPFRFGTLAIPFVNPALPVSFRLNSEETLKAVGPFYLVSMPEEVVLAKGASMVVNSNIVLYLERIN